MTWSLAIVAWLLAGSTAHAGPVATAIVAAVGITGTAATIAASVLTIAGSFALSYVVSAIFKPKVPKTSNMAGGTQLDIRVDAKVPRSFCFGKYVTAGSLAYANTWGAGGEQYQNSNLLKIIALADHPVDSLIGVFCAGAEAETDDPDEDGEIVLPLYDKGAKHQVSLKFYDGTQVSADALAVSKFGAADMAWTANEVGTDVAYVRISEHYDPGKIDGSLDWKFVLKGALLYDPRRDSTVGGSGSHVWGTQSTYEWTENPAVIAYNILRGIYVGGEFFYGLKGTAASQLPLDNWFAAMNACDATITSGEDTIAKYAAGGEVTVDTPPMDTIRELAKSCGATFVGEGGIFKFYVDAPSVPDFTFTDDDIVASEEGSFKPILPLETRINYVTGSITSPEKWSTLDLPPLADSEQETADGRRLPVDLPMPMVNHQARGQLLMRQLRERSRRERRHTITLWRKYAWIEQGHVGAWTSTRNDYDAKLFVVSQIARKGNLSVQVELLEVDPTDYDWDEEYEQPVSDGSLLSSLPPAKVIGGFTATAVTVEGDQGTRRSGIKLQWTDPDDGDVVAIRYELRRADEPLVVVKGPDIDASLQSVIISSGLAPETAYEVRARFVSFNGYEAAWSLWIPVTTLDDYIGLADFSDELRRLVAEEFLSNLGDARRATGQIADILARLQADFELNKDTSTRSLQRAIGQVVASYTEDIAVAVGPDSALAMLIEQLDASVGDIVANANAKWVVGVTPSGAIAAYELTTTAHGAKSGLRLVAQNVEGQATGQLRIDADKVSVGKSDIEDFDFVPMFTVDTVNKKIYFKGDLFADGSITAQKLSVGSLSAIAANIGTITAGRLLFQGPAGSIDINGSTLQIVISDNS